MEEALAVGTGDQEDDGKKEALGAEIALSGLFIWGQTIFLLAEIW